MQKLVFELTLIIVFVCIENLVKATEKVWCNGWTLKGPKNTSLSCDQEDAKLSLPEQAWCNRWVLGAPENGNLSCYPQSAEEALEVGAMCTLHCALGYRPLPDISTCSENEGWVPINTPQCEVVAVDNDTTSTKTLVIVLAIIGSIIFILALSCLYAKTSKVCRKRRRKLEERDPELAARRLDVNDTSAYNREIRLLRRRRRFQAKRQRPVVEKTKKRKVSVGVKSNRSLPEKVHARKRHYTTGKRTKKTKDVKVCDGNSKQQMSKHRKDMTPRQKRTQIKKIQNLKTSKENSVAETVNHFLVRKERTKIKTVSSAKNPSARDPSPTSSLSTKSASSKTSTENKIPPRKEAKKMDDSKTPASRATKSPPKRPPPPKTKTPATQLPATKHLPVSLTVTKPHLHPDTGVNRMEILSPGPEDLDNVTGNPYDNYPAALSYRHYQNFENDYRRTTSDYHLQITNVKLIPIKPPKDKTDKKAVNLAGNNQKEKRIKSVQGGVKFISINSEENI